MPAVAAVAVAVLVLLILLAGEYLSEYVARGADHVPGIGGAIAKAIRFWARVSLLPLRELWDHLLKPLGKFIVLPIAAIQAMIDAITGAFHAVLDSIGHLYKVSLPYVHARIDYWAKRLSGDIAHLDAVLRALIAAQIAAAIATTEHYARAITDTLSYHVNVALAELTATLNRAVSYLNNRIDYAEALAGALAASALSQATKYAESLYRKGVAYVDAQIAVVRSLITAGVAEAESVAGTLATAAEHAAVAGVDAAASAAIGLAWPTIIDEINALEGVIATDLPDIGAAVRAIPREAVGVAGALAGVGALDVVITRYLRECGIPNCRNLGGFGRDLQSILGVIGDAAFLAFLVELVRDPSGAARTFADIAEPVTSPITAVIRDVAGV